MGDEVWEKLPLSVTTWVNHAAGLPFFSLEDLANRKAVYQEFTNHALRRRGFEVPLWTPAEAGRVLAERMLDFDLLLYEYFRTDAAGHSQDMERAEREIRRLEEFIEAFLEKTDLDRTLVVLSSDHGNIEDLSVRTHTLNPALTILWGSGSEEIAARIHTIMDVPGELLRALGIEEA
jgi:predicted AlkP superfamily pyrophosphatase or phosphodiesterase